MPHFPSKPLKDGWNTFRTNSITLYPYFKGKYKGGTHVFKWKKDARDWAGWQEILVPTIIHKKDITTLGIQGGGTSKKLVLVASKAKFNLSKAVRAY